MCNGTISDDAAAQHRRDAAQRMICMTLTDAFVAEVAAWGIDVAGKVDEIGGRHIVEFVLTYESESSSALIVDVWSGRMLENGVMGSKYFISVETTQRHIRAEVDKLMESLTASG